MKQTKVIPKVIAEMLEDINIDKSFREQIARSLGIDFDDHEDLLKQEYDTKMLKEAEETLQEEEYYQNTEREKEEPCL